MTKTYNDIDAITRLLEEKQRDLELAARIGQNLLAQNEKYCCDNDNMQNKLDDANDKIKQLRHELNSKDALLKVYDQDIECNLLNSPTDDFPGYTVNMIAIHDRVQNLENENQQLKIERDTLEFDMCEQDAKEQSLTAECVKHLQMQNEQTSKLQDELATKSEVVERKQDEISSLLIRVIELESITKRMHIANSELSSHLNRAQTSQCLLTKEISKLSEQYNETSESLKAARDEIISYNKQQKPCIIRQHYGAMSPYLQEQSLAFELRRSLGLDDSTSSESGCRDCSSPLKERRKYINSIMNTIDSVEKKTTPTSTNASTEISSPKSYNGDNNPISSTDIELALKRIMMRKANECNETYVNSLEHIDERQIHSSPLTASMNFRPTPKRLQIIKPMEGSEMLRQWKELATPSFNFNKPRPGILSRDDSVDNLYSLKDKLFSLDDIEEEIVQPRITVEAGYTTTLTISSFNRDSQSLIEDHSFNKLNLSNTLNIIEANPLDLNDVVSINGSDTRQSTTNLGLNTIMNLTRKRGQCSRIVEDNSIRRRPYSPSIAPATATASLIAPLFSPSSCDNHLSMSAALLSLSTTPSILSSLSSDGGNVGVVHSSFIEQPELKFNFPVCTSTPKPRARMNSECFVSNALNTGPLSSVTTSHA